MAKRSGTSPRKDSKALAVRVHVHEHEAAPATHLYLAQANVVVGEGGRVVVAIDHLFDVALEVPTPGVVPATDLGGGEVADARRLAGYHGA